MTMRSRRIGWTPWVRTLGRVDRRWIGLLASVSTMFGCDPIAFDSNDDAMETTDTSDAIDMTGGGDSPLTVDVPPITDGDWYRPGVATTWQWQLQPGSDGRINMNYDADVYDIDLFDVDTSVIDQLHRDGRTVVCYFSAGSFEEFREDAGSFDADDLGKPLADFADERWLDIRSTKVHAVMRNRLDLAAEKGCDGVEPDNVTGFANDSGFDLSAADQLAFNRFLANAAHARGLSVALKNDLDQIPELVDYFDFAVNEQCHEFDECDLLAPFVDTGKAVFNAEYADRFVDSAGDRASMCADARTRGLRTLVLPIDLDDSFRFSCDP